MANLCEQCGKWVVELWEGLCDTCIRKNEIKEKTLELKFENEKLKAAHKDFVEVINAIFEELNDGCEHSAWEIAHNAVKIIKEGGVFSLDKQEKVGEVMEKIENVIKILREDGCCVTAELVQKVVDENKKLKEGLIKVKEKYQHENEVRESINLSYRLGLKECAEIASKALDEVK